MLARLFFVLLVLIVAALGMRGFKRWQLIKAESAVSALLPGGGKPALVYFSSPQCAVCRSSQMPVLARLLNELCESQIELVNIDVFAQPQIAKQWGVTTVPSVFVVAADGRIANINNGLVGDQALRRQLASLGG